MLKQKQCVESMKIKIDRNECYRKQGNNLCSVWDQTALQSVIHNIKAYIHYIPKTKIKKIKHTQPLDIATYTQIMLCSFKHFRFSLEHHFIYLLRYMYVYA